MATTVGNMTLDELKRLIASAVEEAIEERLTSLLGGFDIEEDQLVFGDKPDTRTWEEVKRDIERDRWTPPHGAKSSLELLREDRDQ